jgi:hypothetical protein
VGSTAEMRVFVDKAVHNSTSVKIGGISGYFLVFSVNFSLFFNRREGVSLHFAGASLVTGKRRFYGLANHFFDGTQRLRARVAGPAGQPDRPCGVAGEWANDNLAAAE